uniref:HMG box domain-containing protein n=2 Tax=Cacopsylla melanoneura TaxID=428564 RepID=A0A8D9AMU4_9HEMI
MKPAGSAYALFSQEYLNSDEAKHIKSSERMKIISVKWNILSDEKKKEFNNLVKEKSAAYSAQYAAFLQKLSPDETNNFLKYHTLPDFLVYNPGDLVKTEMEDDVATNTNDDFPKSPKEYYRLKSKEGVKWKNLSDDEKQKWKKKFAKRQKKHLNSTSIVSLGNETENFRSRPPLYNSTPLCNGR